MSPSARRGRIVTQNELMIVTGQLLAFIVQRLPRQQLRRGRRDLALDAGHRHAAGDRAVDRHELHARKPALAGIDGQLRRNPRVCCSGSAPSPRPRAEFDEVKAMAVEDYKSKMGSWKDLRCSVAPADLRRRDRAGRHPADHAASTRSCTTARRSSPSPASAAKRPCTANIANGVISVLATFVGHLAAGQGGPAEDAHHRPDSAPRRRCSLIGVFSAHPPRGHRPGLRDPGPDRDVPGLPAGCNLTGHLADALGDLPAEDPRPGHGRLGLRAVDRELPGWLRLPAAPRRDRLSSTFFVFAVLGVGAIAFAAKYIPETKDKSLEDLEHFFKQAAAREPVTA